MTIDFSRRVAVPSDVLFRELDGEAVILNLNSESYFGLDEIGTHMWRELTEAPSIEDAYATLLEAYDVDPARLRSDMDELLTQLLAAGLLALDDGPVA